MCLETVSIKLKPNDDMVVGYKVFEMDRWGHPHSKYWSDSVRRIGKHYRSEDGKIRVYGRRGCYKYDNGFHFYTSKIDAFRVDVNNSFDKVYEVHLWDIRAYGFQWGVEVGVAKNMRIIGQVKP